MAQVDGGAEARGGAGTVHAEEVGGRGRRAGGGRSGEDTGGELPQAGAVVEVEPLEVREACDVWRGRGAGEVEWFRKQM